MSQQRAREIAVRLRQQRQQHFRAQTRGVLDDAGRLILGPTGKKAGVLAPEYGGTGGTSGGGGGGEIPPPPDTYSYLIDLDGDYLVDSDGAYLYELEA